MSLDKLKKFQLIDAGEWFGVDGVEDAKNNEDRVTLLLDDGITWELYEEERKLRNLDKNHEVIEQEDVAQLPLVDDERPAPESQDEDVVLIKMERKNFSFEHAGVRLYRFTRDHPYQVVNVADEQALINMGGFRSATQSELAEFYR